MERFCGNCGSKVEGEFCSNCGTKVGAPANTGVNTQMQNKENHATYRLVVGIIMIILGSCIFIASVGDNASTLEAVGYNTFLGFTIPGLCALAGGILSIVSRKNNQMLLFSGICFVVTAISNMCGIKDISLLFILCCIFAPLNFVFYSKANKE